jgi:hypothetical protein
MANDVSDFLSGVVFLMSTWTRTDATLILLTCHCNVIYWIFMKQIKTGVCQLSKVNMGKPLLCHKNCKKFPFSNCQNFPFPNCQNFPFQTVKISFSKLLKFPFPNCQNFLFQTVKISLSKLSKFPFPNRQNFLFQTVKISFSKPSKFSCSKLS